MRVLLPHFRLKLLILDIISHWSVDATGSDNPLQISVNSNLSVTANFILEQHLLTLNADPSG